MVNTWWFLPSWGWDSARVGIVVKPLLIWCLWAIPEREALQKKNHHHHVVNKTFCFCFWGSQNKDKSKINSIPSLIDLLLGYGSTLVNADKIDGGSLPETHILCRLQLSLTFSTAGRFAVLSWWNKIYLKAFGVFCFACSCSRVCTTAKFF